LKDRTTVELSSRPISGAEEHDTLPDDPSSSSAGARDRRYLNGLKADILRKRRHRIRKTTYAYVARLMIEDTAPGNPHRSRMVLDWWHRVVDPLEAEKFDVERLRYFRERFLEHQQAPSRNAAIRKGKLAGKQLRRVPVEKASYYRLQISRLSDRTLNYAAAEKAVRENDAAFRQLLIGLVELPKLSPGANSWLGDAAWWGTSDRRAKAILSELKADPSAILPEMDTRHVARRIDQLTNRFDLI
jgi:hypothetical protein